ncbi:MAG: YchJ family protein [Hydrogenovibrio sp.]
MKSMPSTSTAAEQSFCLCGRKVPYRDCCEPFHLGRAWPETAEQLMRSRYVAYALHLKDYLLQTWDPSTRPSDFTFDENLHWQKLRILKTKRGRAQDNTGSVVFRAEYCLKDGGLNGQPDRVDSSGSVIEKGVMTEKSRFVRDHRQSGAPWVYLDGELS